MIIRKRHGAPLEVTSNYGATYREGLDILADESFSTIDEGVVYVGFSERNCDTVECLSLTVDEVRRVRDELNKALEVFGKKAVIENSDAINATVNLDAQSIINIEKQIKDIQEQLRSFLKVGLVLGQ